MWLFYNIGYFFDLSSDFNAADLAADGFRQFVDKFHHARILVGGGGALHVVLDVFYQRLVCPVFVSFDSTMVALTTCPRISSGTPVMAHSTTAGWVISALSTSNGPMR